METPTVTALRSELTSLLNRYRCTAGTFRAERGNRGFVLSLQGTRDDGKPVFVWEWPAALQKVVHNLFDRNSDLKAFTLTLDLHAGTADYRPENAEAYAARETARQEEAERENRRDLEEKKRLLAATVEPYGQTLAQNVLARLRLGHTLAYYHRDYCGTGLWLNDGRIEYGDRYDGGADRVLHTFDNDTAFISWLAAQSNASLARLEEENPFYWGNQTLTRARLEAFCG